MKNLWFAMVAATLLASGCSFDRTLETLVPRNSLAVVLVDHPSLVALALGSGAQDLPLKSLDGSKPWAAAVVPAGTPGFLLAVALANQDSAWTEVQAWARSRGGLEALRFGTYAVLTPPGSPAPAVLDADRRFDLEKVRAGGYPLSVYIDVKNVLAASDLPVAFRSALSGLPWAEKYLAGVRLGFSAKDGGLEARLATDWVIGADPASELVALGRPSDLAAWSGLIPETQGFGVTASIPPRAWVAMEPLLHDPALVRRWSALTPLLGPRIAVSVYPHGGGWSWAAAIESSDPQGVRQALKTLVASGEIQKHFTDWAMDADTPLIYQDKPEAGVVQTQLSLGSATAQIGYGEDRIAVAGGENAEGTLAAWGRSPGVVKWFREAPSEATLIAGGAMDGIGARAALKVLADGNVELRVWMSAAEVKTWEERLPQAALGWLRGEAGSQPSMP